MLVLAADTSGKEGSIALLRALADGSCETIDVVTRTLPVGSSRTVEQS